MYLKGIHAKECGENCEKCTLNQEPFVPGYGPDDPDIVLIGKGPSWQEVKKGRPFVGATGELLADILGDVHLKKEDIYTTNTVLCHPPDNRTPYADEVNLCKDRLIKEVKDKDPKVVGVMGNDAMRAVIGEQKITQRRGTVRESEHFEAPVIPTFHPGAALRVPGRKRQIRTDFRMMERMAAGDEEFFEPLEPEYVVFHSREDTETQLNFLVSVSDPRVHDYVVLDLEWASDGTPLCLGLKYEKLDKVIVLTGGALRRIGEFPLLFEPDIVGHNTKSDIQKLWELGVDCEVAHDTQLLSYVLEPSAPRRQRGLKRLAADYYIAGDYDAEIQEYITHMEDCPIDLMCEYNATDVLYTEKLFLDLPDDIKKQEVEDGYEGLKVYSNLLIPVSNPLAEMEYNGVKIDEEQITEAEVRLEEDVEKLTEELHELAGKEFNPNSPVQVAEILYDDLNLPIPGERSTKKELLEKLERFHPIVGKQIEYRKLSKLLSTYASKIPTMVDENYRLHTNFNIDGTKTGRLSSSKPNLQNIPKRSERGKVIKRAFVPSDDKVLIEVDLSQAELRCLAYYSGDENLLDAFIKGEDIHKRTASLMFGVPLDEVTDHQRNIGKTLNFATLYGSGPSNIASLAECSMDEAKQAIKDWFRAYPSAAKWMRQTSRQGYREGYVETPTGRRRYFTHSGLSKAEIERRASNTRIQSLASDIMLKSLIEIYNQRHKAPGDFSFLLTVHDSGIFETSQSRLAEKISWLVKVMEDVGNKLVEGTVPIIADAAIGYNWADLVDVNLDEDNLQEILRGVLND